MESWFDTFYSAKRLAKHSPRTGIFFLLLCSQTFAQGEQAQEQELIPPIPGFEWCAENWDDPNEFKKDKIVVSLGYNCAAARHFQHHKLAEAYLPFDWCFSNFESIYLTIQNDFKDFLSLKLSIISSGENYHEVFDETYFIKFVHDFVNHDQNLTGKNIILYDYDHNKQKYERRINRLRRALRSKKEVYLFRTVITKREAMLLRDLISRKFPELKYTLAVMNDTEEFKNSWNEKNISNFYLKEPTCASVTEEMQKAWEPIFKSLKLVN